MLSLTHGTPIARIEYKNAADKPKDKRRRFLYLDTRDEAPEMDDIVLPKGQTLVPLPIVQKNQREVLYITGPSGSGKSTYVGNYLNEFFKAKSHREHEYHVISSVKQDKVLDAFAPNRIPIDNELINDPLACEDFQDSLVVFDDTGTISNKKHLYAVNSIRDDLLEQGRHTNTTVCITSHLMSDYKNTRKVLNESTSVTFFPRGGSSYQIKQFLKTYAGMDAKMISKVMKLPSRWVTLYKRYPNYVLYEKGVFLTSIEL
jgi:energy-coupling factor transporter ATP-binding protein EcfA2